MYCLSTVFTLLIIAGCAEKKQQVTNLKDAFKNKFYIGVAMDSMQIIGEDTLSLKIVKDHFNSIVAENCMKSEVIQPIEGQFNFELSDKFVEFGEQNNMFIIGHTLIWHSQVPKWFFVDSLGNDVSREVLINRMKNHIQTLVSRYKGRVKGWDVVNEAILDDGSWRTNKFYDIIGEGYIKMAFQFAHEADPDAELYYNDYSMTKEGKRNGVVSMVRKLQEEGIKIDGIGMQAHCVMDYPSIMEFEKSILAFAALNINVMITELDLSILPQPEDDSRANVSISYEYQQTMNPYVSDLPESVSLAHQKRYLELFKLFIKHHDKISRVTLWGVTDNQSWKNNWPIYGRKDYPLLFDRQYQPKPFVNTIINEAISVE
ncbi:MAG: endo-1,4-beta-xylanase [Bacteroidales bacterium]|nr:endo-1,4-beta-xylanase [Bacteroidales bacterium]